MGNWSVNFSTKILRHPGRLDRWRKGLAFAPVGVEIDLSNRCSLGCEFCHFAYTHTRGPLAGSPRLSDQADVGDLMDLALLERLAVELRGLGVQSVTFSGGGEPTLHPQFSRAVDLVTRTGLSLGLYTNGAQLDAERAELIKRNCRWVVVSLDEATAESYREVKGVNAFERACNGVRYLVAAPGTAVVGVSFLITRQNNQDLFRMIALHRALGAHYAEFRPAVRFDLEHPGQPAEDTSWMDPLITHLHLLGHQPDLVIPLDKFLRYRHWSRDYPSCEAIKFTTVVTPNGRVWDCVNLRGHPSALRGDLRTESFAEIWSRIAARTDFAPCRVLCRGDALNRTLRDLATPVPHEEFI